MNPNQPTVTPPVFTPPTMTPSNPVPPTITPQSGTPPQARKKQLIAIFGTIVLVAIVVIRIALMSSSSNKIDMVAVAADAKKQLNVPVKTDEYTTLTDITSGEKALQYHYILSSAADWTSVTDAALKDTVKESVCANSSTVALLNKDIEMQYSYQVENSSTTFSFSIIKADCTN